MFDANGNIANNTILGSSASFSYDLGTHTATWTFSSLIDGKYSIHLAAGGIESPLSVVDVAGNDLDGEWTNDFGTDAMGRPSADAFGDDLQQTLVTGNGVAGSTDSDGDGVVDGDDEDVWSDNFAEYLPFRNVGNADFQDDEIIDGFDLTIWQNGFGGTNAGDVDGDGDTDGNDFLLWQQVVGMRSAWAAGLPQVQPFGVQVGALPRVLNVIVSGCTLSNQSKWLGA